MKRNYCLLAALLLAAGSASAGTIYTYNFYPATTAGDTLLGTTQVYSSSSVNVTAAGFAYSSHLNNWSASDLYTKNDGSGERGLGVPGSDAGGEHEITPTGFIQLDISQLSALNSPAGSLSAFSITMGSTTDGEGFKIYGSNTAFGSSGLPVGATLLDSGASNGTYNFTTAQINSDFQYIDVTAYCAGGNCSTPPNVLVQGLAATQTAPNEPTALPEPTTALLLPAGLFALIFLKRRRLLRQS